MLHNPEDLCYNLTELSDPKRSGNAAAGSGHGRGLSGQDPASLHLLRRIKNYGKKDENHGW